MLNIVERGHGFVEVICGCMYAGKTEEMIRRLRRARIAQLEVIVFKPAIDKRYAEGEVVSHSENRLPSLPVGSSRELLERVGDAQVVGVDEAQFFDEGLTQVVRLLANQGRRVVIAGLDADYRGISFGVMPELITEAEFVTKLAAVCHRCGAPAHRTQRIGGSSEQVQVGGQELYEARCRSCWEPPDDVGNPTGQTRLFNGVSVSAPKPHRIKAPPGQEPEDKA